MTARYGIITRVGFDSLPDELILDEEDAEEVLLEDDALEVVMFEDEVLAEVLLEVEYLFAYQSFFSIPFVSI